MYNYYEIQYLSTLETGYFNEKTATISSKIKLSEGADIIVHKDNQGLFLARVGDLLDKGEKKLQYQFVDYVDVTEFYKEQERIKKRAELEKQMEQEFKKIDKMRKYEYYSTLDEHFNNLYREYQALK